MSKARNWYLYAVTGKAPELDLSVFPAVAANAAERPDPPEILGDGPLAAIASPFAGDRVRPERRNLAAHHGLLNHLMKEGVGFLPAGFGMLAGSRRAILETLRAHRQPLLADLRRLSGRVEMGLKVVWDVPNIFEFMASRSPDLVRLRDGLLKKPGGPGRDDKIDLGRTFERLLNEARENHVSAVTGALGTCLVEYKANPPRDEKTVMNLACLVGRDQKSVFEQRVFQAAALFDDNYAFDYNGPWPPFNFVSVSLAAPLASANV